MFRDESGKPANIDTVSRWCRREFGMTFQEFRVKNGKMALKIALRKNQLELSKKNAAMAIFLGKNILGQSDTVRMEATATGQLADLIDGLKEPVDNDIYTEATGVDGGVED